MSAFGKCGAADDVARDIMPEQDDGVMNVYQRVGVSAPVTITPYATVGEITAIRCGNPQVTEGTGNCEGTLNSSCCFTVYQTLCVTVPVTFGCDARAGGITVNSLGAGTDDPCENCGQTRSGFRL